MAYLDKQELNNAYFESTRVFSEWYKPFNEYERIAGNKISTLIGKNMPRVNDGSLAASLLETPMQVLPSMQPGKFTALTSKDAWKSEIANIIWKTKIVPNANTQAAFFDKEQIALYRALKYGVQWRYNFFVSTETYNGSDWSLPYVKNVKLEPGKFSIEDCDYVFMDVYYTKLQLQDIIKNQGKKKDTTWNVDAAKKLVNMAGSSKDLEDQNAEEKSKAVNASGIKTTICFHRGIGAPFYMFSKHLEAGELLREWKNPDPTGDLPLTAQYCYETLESPVGIGRVELAGPTQNVLDYMTQAHVLATQLGLQPPKMVKGATDSVTLSSLVNAPDALWLTGQASVDVVQNTNSVYTQFPANFSVYKAQLQNLQGRTDGSVSSEAGDPGFSKTQAGVKMQETRTNAQDNYLRNKADTASAKMAQKMMNVHMAQMEGMDIIDIVEDDYDRLYKSGFFDDNPATPEPSLKEVEIDYNSLKETYEFKYDPRPEADEDEKNRWLELIDITTSNPNVIPALQAQGYEFDIGEAFKKVISASGADGWEKVLKKLDPEQAQIDPVTGQPMTQDPNAEMPMEQGMDAGPEMPMEGGEQVPQDIPPEIQDVMDMYGVDPQTAMAVLEARSKGFDEGEIVDFLKSNGALNQGVQA